MDTQTEEAGKRTYMIGAKIRFTENTALVAEVIGRKALVRLTERNEALLGLGEGASYNGR